MSSERKDRGRKTRILIDTEKDIPVSLQATEAEIALNRRIAEIESETEPAPEVNFEAGLSKIVEMVEEKLKSQSTVAIGIMGASANVGKTELSKALHNLFLKRGVPTYCAATDADEFKMSNKRDDYVERSKFFLEQPYRLSEEKTIIIVAQAVYTTSTLVNAKLNGSIGRHGRSLVEHAPKDIPTPPNGYDFMVGIYVPGNKEKEFFDKDRVSKYVDLMICNDPADWKNNY